MLKKIFCSISILLVIGLSAVGNASTIEGGKDYFFRYCLGCHSFACNRESGPGLGGLFGRKAGSAEGYEEYSDDLKGYDVIWNDETLDEFFKSPSGKTTGIMADVGKIDGAKLRQQLIAFLKTEDPKFNLCPQ